MTLVRNKPTADGYTLGEHLDRFFEQEIEKYRQTGIAVPQRCNTCAFRKGTYANGCVPTVMDALKCAVEGETFLCHEHRPSEEPPVCAGYLLLAAKPGTIKAPWKFCDEYAGDNPTLRRVGKEKE